MSLFEVPGWNLGAVKPPPVLSNRKLKAEKKTKRKAEAQERNESVKKQKVEDKQQLPPTEHNKNPRKAKEPVARNQGKKDLRSKVNEGERTNVPRTDNGKEPRNKKNRNKKDSAPPVEKGTATSDSPEQPDIVTGNRKDKKAAENKKKDLTKKDNVQAINETGIPEQSDVAASNNRLEEKETGNKRNRNGKNKLPEKAIETSGLKQSATESNATKPVLAKVVPKGSLPSTKPLSKNDKKKLLQTLQREKERQNVAKKPQTISANPSSKIETTTVTETEGFVRTSQVSQNDPSNQLTRMQQEMQKKLRGAKFRWLNEQLYTTSGEEGFKLFNEQPELFEIYHSGFRSQVESWPTNPLDIMIEQLKQASEDWIVADMGCGEARLSVSIPQNVHSFDLVAANDRIVACDVKHVPLPDEHVDVVVFCLALMGTNYLDFLKEAYRIMKSGGELKIAEVTSRITDVKAFVNSLSTLGFTLVEKDVSNSHFILFRFTKSGTAGKRNGKKSDLNTGETAVLKPCIYKRR